MRKLFLTFLITSSFFVYSKSAKNTKSAAQSTNQQSVQAKGVIIGFHIWPNAKDTGSLLRVLQAERLTKKVEIERFKVWVYEWSQIIDKSKALKVCDKLSRLNISSVKYCEPDSLVTPDEITIDDLNATGDLRSCSVVSSSFKLLENKLSDYWAKELIGADLLREDLENTSAPDKENFISIFDLPKDEHDARVKHVISDDTKNGVLPELDVEVFHTPFSSDGLVQANKLLDRVDQECSDQGDTERDLSSQNTTTEGSATGGDTTGTATTTTGGDTTGTATTTTGGDTTGTATTTTGGDTTGTTTQGDTTGSTTGPDANSTTTTTTTTTGGDTTGSTTGGNTADHIKVRKWANEKDIPMNRVLSFISRENIPISRIDSPYKAGLVNAGESYSPTIRVVPSKYSDKLEAFAATMTPPNYSRTLSKVVWKNSTDWNTEWKSVNDDQSPGNDYDLTADYEVDMGQTNWLYNRSYSYIFRPPVLDMRGGSSISTDLFNWLPLMVLVSSSKKIKIWGKWRVGKLDGTATGTNAPLVINGVSVQMTLVPGTISTVPGTAKNHGTWEATLSASDFATILGTVSSNEDISNRRTASEPDQPSVGTR